MGTTTTKIELTGSIPTKPHLKKFVQYLEHLPPDGVLDLNSIGAVPFFFRLLLEGKTNLYDSNSFYDIHKDQKLTNDYTDSLQYTYTSRMLQFNRFYLSRKNIRAFNLYVHRLFIDFLVLRVQEGIENGKTEKHIMQHYFDVMDIEAGTTMESVKRALTRARKRKKIPTIYRKNREFVENV